MSSRQSIARMQSIATSHNPAGVRNQARNLTAVVTPAIAGTALYQDLTESIVERTDEQGATYYLVASECAAHRYYGVRNVNGAWITSTDTDRLAKKLIRQVEVFIAEQYQQAA